MAMRPFPSVFALFAFPVVAAAQVTAPAASTPAHPSAYRGFAVGATYRDFAQRARGLQRSIREPLVCTTSRRTAQLMECRVFIRDTTKRDSAAFELSAHFIDGRAGFISFGDSGGPALVQRMQDELRGVLGAPTSEARGTWEWREGRRFLRLNWRGIGEARWIYLTLTDLDVLDQVRRYVTPAPVPRDSAPSPTGARPGG
jgi:hypothetical protein